MLNCSNNPLLRSRQIMEKIQVKLYTVLSKTTAKILVKIIKGNITDKIQKKDSFNQILQGSDRL